MQSVNIITIRDALGKFCQVCLILQDRHHDLLHQGAEVLQGVGVDVPAGHVIQQLVSLVRKGLGLALDKKDTFVPAIRVQVFKYVIFL